MSKISTTFVLIACLFFIALSAIPLKGQEPNPSQDRDQYATAVLQEAEALIRKLPKGSQAVSLAMVTSEYERRGKKAEANRLWLELDELLEQSDSASREKLLMTFAKERARAGYLEKAKSIAAKIEDEAANQKAIQAIALVLTEQSKFKDAIIYAESMPRHCSVLFETMEELGLAVAKTGDTELASRAARGMNPGFGGSMERKLIAMSWMANSYWRMGKTEDAINSMRMTKRFSDLMGRDLGTMIFVDTTLAALQSKDLGSDIETLAGRISESKENDNKDALRLMMAEVLLNFDRDDLLPNLKGDDENYLAALERLKFDHVVKSGNVGEFKKFRARENWPVSLIELITMANTCREKEQFVDAKSFLDEATTIVQADLKSDSRPSCFDDVFSDFVSAKVSAGQQAEALAVIRKQHDSTKIPKLMIRAITAVK